MSAIGVIVAIGAIYLYFRFKKQQKASAAFAMADESEAWLRKHGLDPSNGSFSVYSDPDLVLYEGATAVIGDAQSSEGSFVGYAVEVVAGKGVVRGEIIEPANVISYHRDAAEASRNTAIPIVDMLRRMAERVRDERSRST